ncbi:MAG: LuxR C-terminal-related transcriptional regulator [Gammaproteobacteria bacterium]
MPRRLMVLGTRAFEMTDASHPPARRPAAAALQVLIVDDHALFADGLALLLEQLAGDVHVTRSSSCEAALDGPLADGAPDLLLFDLMLPGVRHLQALAMLAARARGAPIVAVSADERPQVIADVLRAGASGFIPKSTGAQVMLGALRLVLAGGVYVPDVVLHDSALRRGPEGLTQRERQVLDLVVAGHGNQAIADLLDIAESTVRVHVTSIFRRYGVRSRAALLARPDVAGRPRGDAA